MVEKAAVTQADAVARKHPISAFRLDALTAGAAKLRPDRLALRETGPGTPARTLTYRQFDGEVRALAQHLVDLGLAPGERILILTGARTACVVAAIAALSVGLEPLLAPIGLDGAQLATIADTNRCVAIAGLTSYGELSLEETLFETAARSETIRLVAALGPGDIDGTINLAPERLGAVAMQLPQASDAKPRIATLTFEQKAVFHEQGTLIATALDFIGKAEIAGGSHLLSTLAPASFASLVTGAVASLLSGAPLTLFGPFDAASFLALLDTTGPNHCILPAAILADFHKAGLLRESVLDGAIAVIRNEEAVTAGCDCPLVSVHSFNEGGGIAVERKIRANAKAAPILSGQVFAPVPPARQPQRGWR
jgi:acyl-CoA synthetase (AMP-forming)/AMP-acid ligase II